MKRIIVTGAFGAHEKLAEMTTPTIKAYADRCRADFHCLSGKDTEGWPAPHWAKLKIKGMLRQDGGWYDEAAWIDCDAIVRKDAPNLFTICCGRFGAYPESERFSRTRNIEEYCRIIRKRVVRASHYFNTGVMVIPAAASNALFGPDGPSLEHAARLRREHPEKFFNDQDWINSNLIILRMETVKLPVEFNFMPFKDIWEERRSRAWIIHYAGLYSCWGEKLVELIASDLRAWRGDHA